MSVGKWNGDDQPPTVPFEGESMPVIGGSWVLAVSVLLALAGVAMMFAAPRGWISRAATAVAIIAALGGLWMIAGYALSDRAPVRAVAPYIVEIREDRHPETIRGIDAEETMAEVEALAGTSLIVHRSRPIQIAAMFALGLCLVAAVALFVRDLLRDRRRPS